MACLLALSGCQDSKRSSVSPALTNALPPEVNAVTPPYLTNAQPRLQTIKLYVGAEEVSTELALKPVEIFTGMMWRTNMPEGEAMLFVFADARPRGFYMLNCYVPLSIAYIDPEGVIVEIHDLQPHNESSVPSKASNIQFALEVPLGWFQRHNISAGTLVRTQFGEMKTTFSFRSAP